MTTLIVTEKPNVAERIANSIGRAEKHSKGKVRYYSVDDILIAPAVGHIYTLMEKNGGFWKYPVFDIEWVPSYKANRSSAFTKDYLDNIKSLAKKCESYINACDYDVEGEVIGFNVIKYACNIDPFKENVKRMKFSTLTRESIINAYKNLEPTSRGMADAGLTRHVLDWFWGINLSRALTLAIRRARGYTTLSIGRVQGPTLKILATREQQIKEFKPETYWELELTAIKNKTQIKALHIEGKFWDKDKAVAVKQKCGDTAIVSKIQKKKYEQPVPPPFDLTTLQTEAYKHLNILPKNTLDIAQELYTNAYISYPRTSSQQLPKEINYREIMEKLRVINEYTESINELLSEKALKPKNGKKKDPAHPAIHPTGEVPKGLSTEQKKIYDLVVRRFLAVFGEPAVRETVTVELDNNGEIFIAKGTRTVEKGWHKLYGRYAKFEENELPELRKSELLNVEEINLYEKETQPPKRYTPSSIIREMEKKNLGTKATRSQILDTLYKRGYLDGKSIEVTPLGLNVVDTLNKFCSEVLSEKLTRKFEKEMEQIEAGKIEPEKVIEEGREVIKKISENFNQNEEKIGQKLASSLKSTNVREKKESLGKCLKCDGYLVLRKSKFGGYFIGCDNYPKCKYTISLPKRDLKISEKCKVCGYSTIIVSGKKPWTICVNPECPSKKKT
ncbi:MAG: DNA topoisomerase I [Candidatus Altiarchaeota archaeon]|nr:DNA topoisomerase I [Candidatus Altiarchaeota archaeon]